MIEPYEQLRKTERKQKARVNEQAVDLISYYQLLSSGRKADKN